jgi:glycosyltransferase 2 family protein
MKKVAGNWKVWIGIFISLLFMYLAFHKVDFGQMVQAFKAANYWWFIPALVILFTSHWLRAVRWKFLLNPISPVGTGVLYSSLLIGYMANTFLPAHLGEFLRAYIVGKKRPVSASAVFGTIVIERIIDVFTMLGLLALTMIVFPFPAWVQKSGYISFFGIVVLFGILLVMKKYREKSTRFLNTLLKPFPTKFSNKINDLLVSFLDGIVPLAKKRDYVIVTVLSILIWACYAAIFQFSFFAFDFSAQYSLPWSAALVLLVITTISVLVPSSPGYVGTYHYLCQLSLGLFGIADSPALTFAFVVHGINFLPILIVGLILISVEGISLKSLGKKPDLKTNE